MSPALQALIDKGLFDRLPPTFSTFFFEQIKEWDLLFPAERNYHERLFGLIDRSDPKAVEALFAPLRAIEQKMGVNEKIWPKRQFTLDQVDFLNRSAYYPEWRKAIADIFGRLDPLLDAELARAGRAHLAIIVSPAELPVGPDRMWLRIRDRGKMIPLDLAEAGDLQKHLADFIALKAHSLYETWIIETGDSLPAAAGVVKLSYQDLERYRARLMAEVRQIVEKEDIRGPRQLGMRLKQLKLLASEGQLGRDPILAEFTRAVLLSGNGTLLLNNTFVEWASIQAIRRARPSLAVISFGIRNKIKPFSGLLIYTDQEASNPIPTQMDTLGSYVDLEIFYQYIWQEFEKYVQYRRNTAYLFIGEGMDQMLAIAPPDFPLLSATKPVSVAQVFSFAKDWMGL